MWQSIFTSIAAIIALQSLQGSSQLIAWIQAGTMSGLLASLFFVRWTNHRKASHAYAVPHIFGWLVAMIATISKDPIWFTSCIFIASVLFAISTPFLGVIYQVIYQRQIRGRMVSFIKQWQMLTLVLVSWLLGWALERDPFSYRIFFIVIGSLGVFVSWQTLSIQSETNSDGKDPAPRSFSLRQTFAILKTDQNFSRFMTLQFILGISNLAGVAALQVYFNSPKFLGVSPETAALLTGVLPQLFMFLSLRFWGGRFDRMSIVHYRSITSLCMALGFVLYPIAGSVLFAAIGAIVWGMGRGGGQLAWSIGILAFTNEDKASAYMGVHTFLTGVRGVMAPFIGILILESHLSAAALCWLIAAIMAATALLTLFMVEDPERELAKVP